MSRVTQYNKRITVQTSSQTKSEIGGLTDVWTTLYSCWAKLTPMSKTKRMMYAEMILSEAYEVEMRERTTNIDADCRVVYSGNNYQVLGFIIDGDMVKVDITR